MVAIQARREREAPNAIDSYPAISTMTATSGVNDTYRMFVTTKRDGVGFNLAYIDSGFTVPYKGPFDQGYMRSLFEYGYEKGKAGYHWHKTPPGYQE